MSDKALHHESIDVLTDPLPKDRRCFTCAYYAYQPCFVAGRFVMSAHCGKWLVGFLRDENCSSYVREPGSDDL